MFGWLKPLFGSCAYRKLSPHWRSALIIVKPKTVVRWHCQVTFAKTSLP